MKPEETCDVCIYFEDSPVVPTGGVCHRHPPTMAFGMTPQGPQPAASAFPPTNSKGWCGEWKKGKLVTLAKKIPNKILPMEPGIN